MRTSWIKRASRKDRSNLSFARHLQTADSAYEDGWFGYGTYKAAVPPTKKRTNLRPATTQGVITTSKGGAAAKSDDGRPHLSTRGEAGDTKGNGGNSGGSDSAKADPDRPHLTRRDDSGSDSGKEANDGSSGTSGTTDRASGGSGSTPAGDPDRRDDAPAWNQLGHAGYGFDHVCGNAGGQRSGPTHAEAAHGWGREKTQ